MRFETWMAPERLQVRACQCGFCREHGSLAISDPAGMVSFDVQEASLRRHRFGTGTADYFVCGVCGVYIGAVTSGVDAPRAVVVVSVLKTATQFSGAPVPVSFDTETAVERAARRKANWTPAQVLAR